MDAEIFVNELVAAMEAEFMGPNGDAFLTGLGAVAAFITGVKRVFGPFHNGT